MADGLPNQETGEVDNKYMTLRRPAPSVKTSPGSLSSGRLQPIKNGFVWGTVSVWAKKGSQWARSGKYGAKSWRTKIAFCAFMLSRLKSQPRLQKPGLRSNTVFCNFVNKFNAELFVHSLIWWHLSKTWCFL